MKIKKSIRNIRERELDSYALGVEKDTKYLRSVAMEEKESLEKLGVVIGGDTTAKAVGRTMDSLRDKVIQTIEESMDSEDDWLFWHGCLIWLQRKDIQYLLMRTRIKEMLRCCNILLFYPFYLLLHHFWQLVFHLHFVDELFC